jgi:hypothetical protein
MNLNTPPDLSRASITFGELFPPNLFGKQKRLA